MWGSRLGPGYSSDVAGDGPELNLTERQKKLIEANPKGWNTYAFKQRERGIEPRWWAPSVIIEDIKLCMPREMYFKFASGVYVGQIGGGLVSFGDYCRGFEGIPEYRAKPVPAGDLDPLQREIARRCEKDWAHFRSWSVESWEIGAWELLSHVKMHTARVGGIFSWYKDCERLVEERYERRTGSDPTIGFDEYILLKAEMQRRWCKDEVFRMWNKWKAGPGAKPANAATKVAAVSVPTPPADGDEPAEATAGTRVPGSQHDKMTADPAEGPVARVAATMATGEPAVDTRGPRALLEAATATAPTRKAAEVRPRPFPGRGKFTVVPGPLSKRDAKAVKFWRDCEREEREARALASMKIAQAAPRRPRGAGGGLPKSRAGRRLITAAGIGPAADSHQPKKGTQNGARAAAKTAPGKEGTVPTVERKVAPLGGVRVRARIPPDKAGSGAMRKASRRKSRPRSAAWATRRLRTPRGPKREVQKIAQWKRKRMRRRWRRVQSRPRVKAAPIRGRVRVPPDKTGSLTVESMWNGLPEQQAWLMRLGARMGVG
jgi:hypothetical protein